MSANAQEIHKSAETDVNHLLIRKYIQSVPPQDFFDHKYTQPRVNPILRPFHLNGMYLVQRNIIIMRQPPLVYFLLSRLLLVSAFGAFLQLLEEALLLVVTPVHNPARVLASCAAVIPAIRTHFVHGLHNYVLQFPSPRFVDVVNEADEGQERPFVGATRGLHALGEHLAEDVLTDPVLLLAIHHLQPVEYHVRQRVLLRLLHLLDAFPCVFESLAFSCEINS